ncbi:MAG: hypothetical protein H0W70_00175 [Actinobacteria bacterium]|nr:hypothetical protein [Actinomycetota bacterium]
MRTLVSFLPLLGCGAMVLICMLMMGGGMRRRSADPTEAPPEKSSELHAEVRELRAEVERLRAQRAEGAAATPLEADRG